MAADRVINLAVAGHGTCGKTTFVEELLARRGAIAKAGSVDRGTSVLDHDSEERSRHFTIDASSGHFLAEDAEIQILDTPGYPDFLGAAVDAMTAVETAVIAVDAATGIRVNTRRVWDESGSLSLARMILITRMDSDGADFESRVAEIRETFGSECHPLYLPDQSGPGFSRLIPVFESGDDASDEVKAARAALVESIVESDEDLMERYLADEKIDDEELEKSFATAIRNESVVPIIPCSALSGVGIDEFVHSVLHLAPHANAPIPRTFETHLGVPLEAEIDRSASAPLVAEVFRVVHDPFVGKVTHLRVLAGTAKAGMTVVNRTSGEKERIAAVQRVLGKELETADEAVPGEWFACPKLDGARIGDTYTDADLDVRVAAIRHPRSMVKLAIDPKKRQDETKLAEALHKLDEADSAFLVERNPQTHELVISGRSSLHLDVTLHRLQERFSIEVESHVPRTSYLESIQSNADGHYKHKKQSGGRGQFGEVNLRVAPGELGSGLTFENKIVGGVIPSGFMPAIEKGVKEAMDQGVIAGCPVIDVVVEVFDGSHHAVDSNEAAFKTAGREAFRAAVREARPTLLEPIVEIEIHVPASLLGDVLGDLNGRRAQVAGVDAIGDTQVVKALVPEAEIKRYSIELRSMTAGEGSYSVSFAHYAPVPHGDQAKIIDSIQKENEARANA